MTLDETTAHPNLVLSEKRTQVTWQEEKWTQVASQEKNSAQRFDSLPCVLGDLKVTSGRFYWEVEVGHTSLWDLGVCREGVTRKGRVNISPQNGFWAIRLYHGDYWALSSPETQLSLEEKPQRVGIFLDIENGDISFYNMNNQTHMFSFPKISFSGIVRPFLRLWSCESGPMTIIQVKEN